jgi:uncharacterized protein
MPFLTAEWRDLLLLNFTVEPEALAPWVPRGVELADHNGTTLLSVVGFRFAKSRLLGIPVPFHRDFQQIDLRFYVNRKLGGTWRQGVVSIKELVPKWSIAWVARTTFGDRFETYHMRSRIAGGNGRPRTVEYWWYPHERLNHLSAILTGSLRRPEEGSVEAFVLDHTWGYLKDGANTREYRVEHSPWRVQSVSEPTLDCDVEKLYGEPFAKALAGQPHSAFYAEGSPVAVSRAERLH